MNSTTFLIHGTKRLDGVVNIESAKNSILVLMAGSVLTNETVVIKNCPKILDVLSMVEILNSLGARTEFVENDLYVYPEKTVRFEIDENLSTKLRASVFMTGALLSRFEECRIAYPGGCSIGARPIDVHLECFKTLGYAVSCDEKSIRVKLDKKIRNAKYTFPIKSVGATENAILASVFLKGTVILKNCAVEPEIVDLQNFLNGMGANVCGAGGDVIVINGVKKLSGIKYLPIGDRIEAGTFLLSALICGGNIELKNAKIQNISSLIDKITFSACKIRSNDDIINIQSFGKLCLPKTIVTSPFPGFATDLQSQIFAAALFANGKTRIIETLFESRFATVSEFRKFGADVSLKNNVVTVNGGKKMKGAEVVAKDLRGCAGLILAALGIDDFSVVHGINYLDRGYYEFDKKLRALGADVKRTD